MRCYRTAKNSLKLAIVGVVAVAAFAGSAGVHAQASSDSADAAKSLSLVNAARSSAGVGQLSENAGLDRVAQTQADKMAAADSIFHNSNLGADADAQGVHWTLIGENVGVGPDVQAVHNAFMASEGHHANIVEGRYNVIGVGVAYGHDGSIFITHDFAQVAASAPAHAAPAAVAPQTHTAVPAPVAHAAPVAVHAAPVAQPVVKVAAASESSNSTGPNAVIDEVVVPLV